MEKVVLEFQVPPGQKSHWNGLITSLLSEVIEILSQRKRATSLIHFSRERLTRGEKRQLVFSLERAIGKLQESHGFNPFLNENNALEETRIPSEYQSILQLFQRMR